MSMPRVPFAKINSAGGVQQSRLPLLKKATAPSKRARAGKAGAKSRRAASTSVNRPDPAPQPLQSQAEGQFPNEQKQDGTIKVNVGRDNATWDYHGRSDDLKRLMAMCKKPAASAATAPTAARLGSTLPSYESSNDTEVKQWKARAEQAELRVAGLATEKASLEEQLQLLGTEISSLREGLDNAQTAVQGKDQLLHAANKEIAAMREAAEDREKTIVTLEATVASHQAELKHSELRSRQEESLRRRLHNTIQDLKGSIRVFCRVRPRLGKELERCGDDHIAFPGEWKLLPAPPPAVRQRRSDTILLQDTQTKSWWSPLLTVPTIRVRPPAASLTSHSTVYSGLPPRKRQCSPRFPSWCNRH